MKKLCMYAAAAMMLALCGCGTSRSGDEYEPLTDKESDNLVAFVRHNLSRERDRLTEDQRLILKTAAPDIVKFHYDGDKEGKAYISWDIPRDLKFAADLVKNPDAAVPRKTINVVGYGDLTSPKEVAWTIRIVSQSDVTTGNSSEISKEELKRLKNL